MAIGCLLTKLRTGLNTNEENILDWLQEKDTFVVDRGFHDVLPQIKAFGYNVYMPLFLPKNQKQFTTSEANSNRFVTKVRFVIECVNGRIKQWRFFNKVVPHSSLPFGHGYFSIVCSLINAFRPPFVQHTSAHEEIAREMQKKRDEKNKLLSKLNDKEFMKIKKWTSLKASDTAVDFPKFSKEELEKLTYSVFQVKMAKSYAVEHVNDDGEYAIRVSTDTKNL
ncbi:unnamed protein product [Didymodactylos carnosus]|uniref:DDE Tnp4 domain-containing protein n=1 Tax=Didymodactylos carnosus TaxID=1234261 RepID=A0A815AJ82_9BILA|nr:unnamed protein product [Didymodactylos carnosus]CAF4033159.1 unnamed protein product [Didymodactylos carnosus]